MRLVPRPLVLLAGVGAAAAFAVSLWTRHEWVQAQGMGVWCEQHPQAWPCPGRHWVIQAFLHHRLSSLALLMVGCGAMAWWWRSKRGLSKAPSHTHDTIIGRLSASAACIGLWLACCGLVLYDTERSAAAALLAGLLLVALSEFEGP